MSARSGRCLCGAVGITAREASPRVSVCHCKMCQRWTGGPAFSVAVAAAKLAIDGAEHVRCFAASDIAERAWCDRCGSALWYRRRDLGAGADYEMMLGLFDDMSGLAIGEEIFIDRKPAAYALSGAHERLSEAEAMAKYYGSYGSGERT